MHLVMPKHLANFNKNQEYASMLSYIAGSYIDKRVMLFSRLLYELYDMTAKISSCISTYKRAEWNNSVIRLHINERVVSSDSHAMNLLFG
jgi:hypothetical protein